EELLEIVVRHRAARNDRQSVLGRDLVELDLDGIEDEQRRRSAENVVRGDPGVAPVEASIVDHRAPNAKLRDLQKLPPLAHQVERAAAENQVAPGHEGKALIKSVLELLPLLGGVPFLDDERDATGRRRLQVVGGLYELLRQFGLGLLLRPDL